MDSAGATFVSGFGHLRDTPAFRWPGGLQLCGPSLDSQSSGAWSPSIKSSSPKMALTQTEKGDGSCAFAGLEKFVP